MIAALFLLLATLLFGTDASASSVNQRIRVFHTTSLLDADVPGGNGEDFFRTNDSYVARNAFVVLLTGSPPMGVDAGYTDDDGFITFEGIDSTRQYKLELYGQHDLNHDGERVLEIQDATNDLVSTKSGPFYPNSTLFVTNTISIPFDAADEGNEWINAAAVASWAMFRRPAAFPAASDNGALYVIKMADPNCSTLVAAYCMGEHKVYIDPDDETGYGWQRKYIIVHEFGHELSHWALVPNATEDPDDWMYDVSYEAPSSVTGCQDYDDAHSYVSYEYQSGAIVEGLAHYIAAVAFNKTNEAECRFDLGGSYTWVVGQDGSADQFSCEGYDETAGNPLGADDGGAEWLEYEIPAGRFFYLDTDGTGSNGPCSDNTVTTNRAIELDWMRFFWDLDNKEDMDLADIVDVWTDAGPDSWTAEDGGHPKITRVNG